MSEGVLCSQEKGGHVCECGCNRGAEAWLGEWVGVSMYTDDVCVCGCCWCVCEPVYRMFMA